VKSEIQHYDNKNPPNLTFLEKSRKQIPAFIIVCNAAGKIEEK
jgi:hypothetical protein